jgi:hypothetical protein
VPRVEGDHLVRGIAIAPLHSVENGGPEKGHRPRPGEGLTMSNVCPGGISSAPFLLPGFSVDGFYFLDA